MKKPETLYHSLMYCLKVAVMSLLFALVGNYCLAKEKTPTQVKSDKLVIYASSQEELNAKISEHTEAISAHLILDHRVNFELSSVSKLKQLTILTIEYPIHSERGISGDGGMFNAPLDLAFLNGISELRYLVIDWSGLVLNESAIGQLPNLLFARIPYDAFSQSLFNAKSLKQLEIGDKGIFIILKSGSKLELTSYGYETQFDKSNKQFKKYVKNIRKNTKSETLWPNEILQLTNSGDTVLSISGIHDDNFKWIMNTIQSQEIFKGIISQQGTTRIERVLNNPQFSRTVEYDNNHERIVWTDTYLGIDLLTYKEENYTGNGLKNGVFLQKINDQIQSEEHYMSNTLIYQFPYNGTLPSIPLQNYLENFSTTPKEAFFENNELVTLRTKQYGKSENFLIITIPIHRMTIEGNLTVLNYQSDTLLNATYRNGKLDGYYYYYNESVSDTVEVFGNYHNDKLVGERKVLRKHTSTIANYDEGFLTKLIDYKNDNNQLMKEVIWDPKSRLYKENIWTSDGRLAFERTLDINMKVVNEKKLIKIEQEPLNP